ncbi:MAG: aminotransferase class III-fold pyridoxal phosphate-dependent enzyme [Bacteroidetes Order II. Incertae sedis bacterium]|nr:aminotransferase class III-fold pyridoxal phosphate-dependent enzyme [Bacteroidetes Order II. bacterium]
MFESTLEACPQFSTQKALEILALYWDISGNLKPLDSYQDQNFLVRCEDGARYVLKIANAATPHEWLDLQTRILDHLQIQTPTLPLPRPIPTRFRVEMVQAEGHWWRLVSFLPGQMLSDVPFRSVGLLHEMGHFAGTITHALHDFSHPAAHRPIQWDLQLAVELVKTWVGFVEDPSLRASIEAIITWANAEVQTHAPVLRQSIIHGDITRYNLLVDDTGNHINGLIDFGDVCHSWTVGELAVMLLESVMTGSPSPIEDALTVVKAFHAVFPLSESEISVLPALLAMRSCAIVCASARQLTLEPNNAYVRKQAFADRAAFEALTALPMGHLVAPFRVVCGFSAPNAFFTDLINSTAPLHPPLLCPTPYKILDFSPTSDLFDEGAWLKDVPTPLLDPDSCGLSRFGEAQIQVTSADNPTHDEGYTALGISVFTPTPLPVYAIDNGYVTTTEEGFSVLLNAQNGTTFHAVYRGVVSTLKNGPVEKGQVLGLSSSDRPFQFQLGLDVNPPFRVKNSEKALYAHRVWDPGFLFQQPLAQIERSRQDDLAVRRRKSIQQAQEYYYERPMNLVRGWKQYLIGDDGQVYLDAINNVAHIGHSHPKVWEAATRQLKRLNTNARFLYPNIVEYAERLLGYFPEPLRVVFFVCTGSEANDLALRLARAYTERKDMLVIDGEYHGNTTAVDEISTCLLDNPTAAKSLRPFTHPLIQPNTYRGRFRIGETNLALKYAQDAHDKLAHLQSNGHGLAGFISESLLGSGGGVEMPTGYLQEVYKIVHEAGGVCIADEVQIGFGRMGTHFWGFEKEGVLPDIVTLGKPIGNGHPLSAVVTTPEIAEAYKRQYTYFNTFAGNPVSCEIGHAVLDVLEEEGLQQNADRVGQYLKNRLSNLIDKHEKIGAIYGHGFYLGVDLVQDKSSRKPATHEAMWISERMRQHGIIIYPTGDYYNILKIKPPMCFNEANADYLVTTLDRILTYMS